MADATLQMLVDYRIGLFCSCPRCAWRAVLDGDTLSGADHPIPATAKEIMCKG